MSLMGSLSIGSKAVASAQMALDVTGQNIANANTEGYSRKRVTFASETRRDANLGQLGTGVGISSIERMRNSFLDKEMVLRSTEKGYYEQIDTVYERVENIFIEPTDFSLNESINNFWNSWHELASNPTNLSARQTVVATTQVMVGQFHTISSELRELRLSLNDDLDNHVKDVNKLLKEIQMLNDEIARSEAGQGQNANDSRDRREVVLKQLSEYVQVDWFEDDQGRITITTSGTILVSPNVRNDLEVYRTTKEESDGTKYSEIALRFGINQAPYNPRGGAIRATLDARNNVIPKYESALNEIAKTMVSEVNAQHQKGYSLLGTTGINFFDPSKVHATTINLSAAVLTDANNVAAGSGGQLSSPVGGPVNAQIPAGYPLDVNVDLKQSNPKYTEILQGSMVITMGAQELQEGAGKDYIVNYETGVVSFINTAFFNAGDSVSIDFRYNNGGRSGVGNGENALLIGQLRDKKTTQPDQYGEPTQTIGGFYSSFIGVLGIERNEAKAQMETRTFVIQQLERRQSEISGVSLDEEMANMIRFEHSYQAAARYMSTVSQLMDALLSIV
jgi:flagellar hook-associated protein 1